MGRRHLPSHNHAPCENVAHVRQRFQQNSPGDAWDWGLFGLADMFVESGLRDGANHPSWIRALRPTGCDTRTGRG